jgi:hypothetical protein
MPGKHRAGYQGEYQAALRLVLARLRAEQPDTYAAWLEEAKREVAERRAR